MRYLLFIILYVISVKGRGDDRWGFFAHQKINRLAVFTLPPEMIGFYKHNLQYLIDKSVAPDMRRYVVAEEAARHYIDLDIYGDSALYQMPRYWSEAVTMYTEDTLKAYGIVPYHISRVSYWLINAFSEKDPERILRLSADLGHYIADANVPLHTTENYNGQLTGQYGIHGFWESRLPELFSDSYDLLTGQAAYISDIQLYAWEGVTKAHEALDSVLLFEQQVSNIFSPSKKFGFEEKGQRMLRTYSFEFSEAYHKKLNGMVERRMRASIKMVGDIWLSCWIKAGQPDLTRLTLGEVPKDTIVSSRPIRKWRNHESYVEEH